MGLAAYYVGQQIHTISDQVEGVVSNNKVSSWKRFYRNLSLFYTERIPVWMSSLAILTMLLYGEISSLQVHKSLIIQDF